MTPPRNRRAAVLAAVVAACTALTTVQPVLAAENPDTDSPTTNLNRPKADPTQPAGLNIEDGSKLPVGTARTEHSLRQNVGAVSEGLFDLDDDGSVTPDEVFARFKRGETPDVGLNDTEQGMLQALENHYVAITELLKKAAQNQADAKASVEDALAKDRAAADQLSPVIEWYKGLTPATIAALNAKIAKVNKENKTSLGDITPFIADDPNAIYLTMTDILHHLQNISDATADHSPNNFVSRQYAKALEDLINDEVLAKGLAAFQSYNKALFEAQKSDVIPMQMFMDLSRAQVQVLRLIQAKYAVSIRLLQLYENDVLVPGHLMTVRDAYLDAATEGANSLTQADARERAQLKKATKMAQDLYKGWQADLGNSPVMKENIDEEYTKYLEYRDSEAKQTADNIALDTEWWTILGRAQLIDRKAFAEQKDYDKIDADAQANKEAAEKAKKDLADANKKIDDLNKDLKDSRSDAAKAAANAAEAAKKIGALEVDISKAQAKIAELEEKLSKTPKPGPTDTPKPGPTETPKPGPTDTPEPEETGSSHNKIVAGSEQGGSNSTLKTFGIIGVLLAILGAAAAHFWPQISAMLPKA